MAKMEYIVVRTTVCNELLHQHYSNQVALLPPLHRRHEREGQALLPLPPQRRGRGAVQVTSGFDPQGDLFNCSPLNLAMFKSLYKIP